MAAYVYTAHKECTVEGSYEMPEDLQILGLHFLLTICSQKPTKTSMEVNINLQCILVDHYF